ncbi:AT-rich interactive domain-containing protein 5A [Lissotriton helveticus]
MSETKSFMEDMRNEDLAKSDSDEEEQAFIAGLYQFMKERKTPIERLPHLGFKQINLWRLHQAAEKLGGYQLVTGRRLWKNVYDELGGSPGSTSAATCTRRHYERLVLPYVRYLRGEDDKPIHLSKPMKRYNASKESESGEAVEKNMNTQQGSDNGELKTEERMQEGQITPGRSKEEASQQAVSKSKSDLCWCQDEISNVNCCSLSLPRAYKSLFSTLHVHEYHSILSPLAKKKLLAQASKAESLLCHGEHSSLCLKVKKAKLDNKELNLRIPDKRINCKPVIYLSQEVRCSGLEESSQESASPHFHSGVQEPQGRGSPLHRKDSCMTGLSGFHTYKSEDFTSSACHSIPASDHSFSTSKNFPDPPLQWKESCANGPEIRKQLKDPLKAWTSWSLNQDTPSEGDRQGPPAYKPHLFNRPTSCWVHPMAYSAGPQTEQKTKALLHNSTSPLICHSAEPATKEELNKGSVQEETFRAVSPFQPEGNKKVHQNLWISKGIPQVICRPKPVKPLLNYSAALTLASRINNEAIKPRIGANFLHTTESLKNSSISLSLFQPLALRPVLLPAFSGHLSPTFFSPPDHCLPLPLSSSPINCSSSLQDRRCPLSLWHVQSTYATPHMHSRHLNTKL